MLLKYLLSYTVMLLVSLGVMSVASSMAYDDPLMYFGIK